MCEIALAQGVPEFSLLSDCYGEGAAAQGLELSTFFYDNSEYLKGRGLLVVTYKVHYVGTTFTLKMNSNDKILCGTIVNKEHI